MNEIAEILDLDRYPLDDTSRTPALIESCHREIEQTGMFNLEGLMRPAAVAAAAEEIRPLMDSESFTHSRWHNIYFEPRIDGVADDHPALKLCETVNHTICADQMRSTVVCRIYEWLPLIDFLAAVMQKPRLYLMEDPLARANVMSYRKGEALNWHFDRSEFTVTLLIQNPQAGGDFQYRSALRSDTDPNLDGVARLLRDEDPRVTTLPLTAGTLNVFRGKNTAHRVSPVVGGRDRMVAVFSYYERPGVVFSEEERVGFYGRAG